MATKIKVKFWPPIPAPPTPVIKRIATSSVPDPVIKRIQISSVPDPVIKELEIRG